ncbi:MAG: hypothetical protein LUB59_03595 [Candidatus Gastranaerophilales bacterium]|nr:hypothetical protein [Candidatus Gastranaerophilales bacterium]
MSVNSVTGAGTSSQQTPELKKTDNQESTVTKTIWSNYDSDKNDAIKYDEANSNSLFSRCDLSGLTASNIKADGLNVDTAAIQKKAGFNAITKFAELLNNFNSQTGSTTLTFEDGKVNESKVNKAAQQLDQKAISDANSASQTANEQLANAYQTALNEAYTALSESTESKETGSEGETSGLDGEKADAKEFDKAQNVETKYYADKDKDANSSVVYGEASSDFSKLKNSFKDMAPTNAAGEVKDLKIIKQLANFNVDTAYHNNVSNFNFNSGSTKNQSDVAEMNQKVENAIKDAADKANSSVETLYQEALNKAYTDYTALGKDGVKDKIDQLKTEEKAAKKAERAAEKAQNAGSGNSGVGAAIGLAAFSTVTGTLGNIFGGTTQTVLNDISSTLTSAMNSTGSVSNTSNNAGGNSNITTVTVKKNDSNTTPESVAKANNVSVSDLQKANSNLITSTQNNGKTTYSFNYGNSQQLQIKIPQETTA